MPISVSEWRKTRHDSAEGSGIAKNIDLWEKYCLTLDELADEAAIQAARNTVDSFLKATEIALMKLDPDPQKKLNKAIAEAKKAVAEASKANDAKKKQKAEKQLKEAEDEFDAEAEKVKKTNDLLRKWRELAQKYEKTLEGANKGLLDYKKVFKKAMTENTAINIKLSKITEEASRHIIALETQGGKADQLLRAVEKLLVAGKADSAKKFQGEMDKLVQQGGASLQSLYDLDDEKTKLLGQFHSPKTFTGDIARYGSTEDVRDLQAIADKRSNHADRLDKQIEGAEKSYEELKAIGEEFKAALSDSNKIAEIGAKTLARTANRLIAQENRVENLERSVAGAIDNLATTIDTKYVEAQSDEERATIKKYALETVKNAATAITAARKMLEETAAATKKEMDNTPATVRNSPQAVEPWANLTKVLTNLGEYDASLTRSSEKLKKQAALATALK
jgi:hypothetical protein